MRDALIQCAIAAGDANVGASPGWDARLSRGAALRRCPIINESMADIESEMSQVSEKRLAGVLGNGFCFVASQDDRSGARAGSTQEI